MLEAEISGALDDFEHDKDAAVQEPWQQRDLEIDGGVSYIQSELRRREMLLGAAYPFTVRDANLRYRGHSDDLLYEFFLAISCAPNVTTGRYVELPRTFERISATLTEVFLGGNAKSLHVGTPRDPDVGTQFKDAMQKLHEMSGEFNWDPEDHTLANDPPTTGDEGVDFVAWKAPGDTRPGRIFILGQCACGSSIEEKFDDVNLKKFGKWFRPGPAIEPLRALATPRHIPDLTLREAQREAGLVFDRARLALIAKEPATTKKIAPYRDKLGDLINLVIEAA
jgi:hypothetical protein